MNDIRAVVVALPVRNEEFHIAGCMRSVFKAIDELDSSVLVVFAVAMDSCTDGTAGIVANVASDRSCVQVVSGQWCSVGDARRAAVACGLRWLAGSGFDRPESIWVATTDADSRVPTDWLAQQITLAQSGYDAIAGSVELLTDQDRTDAVDELFRRNYQTGPSSHTHVHGANMGMRAAAYMAAGGFACLSVSEDRQLWNELGRRGFRLISPVSLRVETSARLQGRVAGGFAHAIANSWT
jgi:hypothetical protein